MYHNNAQRGLQKCQDKERANDNWKNHPCSSVFHFSNCDTLYLSDGKFQCLPQINADTF